MDAALLVTRLLTELGYLTIDGVLVNLDTGFDTLNKYLLFYTGVGATDGVGEFLLVALLKIGLKGAGGSS